MTFGTTLVQQLNSVLNTLKVKKKMLKYLFFLRLFPISMRALLCFDGSLASFALIIKVTTEHWWTKIYPLCVRSFSLCSVKAYGSVARYAPD